MRPVVFALLAMVAAPRAAGALPACIQPCQGVDDCCSIQPCLQVPCGDYLGCRNDAQSELDSCVADSKGCQPTAGGRCTIILGCVRDCERAYKAKVKGCRKRFLKEPCDGCKLGTRAQRRAEKICRNCTSVTVTTTTTTTSTSSTTTTVARSAETATPTTSPAEVVVAAAGSGADIDGCMQSCLLRIDSLRQNYGRCDDACDGNGRALGICQEASRNVACKAIKARCSDDGDNPDFKYRQCCNARDTCVGKADAPCIITTTTTSTTSTSTTVVTTTTTTSTTTSPPF